MFASQILYQLSHLHSAITDIFIDAYLAREIVCVWKQSNVTIKFPLLTVFPKQVQ